MVFSGSSGVLVTQDASKIVPPTMKKGTQIYKKKEMADLLYKKYKDSGWWSDLTPEKAFNYLDMYTL